MNAPSLKQRATRNQVEMQALLTRPGGDAQSVQVEDFSIDSCCVRGFFRVGEQVELRMPQMGRFSADVRWARSGLAGLRFKLQARP